MGITPLHERLQAIQPKLHGAAIGATLGIGGMLLGQACPLRGACPTCSACAVRLPLLAVPLLLDGVVLLTGRLLKLQADKNAPAEPGDGLSASARSEAAP